MTIAGWDMRKRFISQANPGFLLELFKENINNQCV